MQRVLTTMALLGCIFTTPVTANSVSILLQPSPAAIILVAGRWLTTKREKVYKVRVQCTGVDEQVARNNCFAKAINDAVGSIVVSDSETSGTGKDRDLSYHELLNYSSGWVHDYEILNKENTANSVQLTMNISVQGNAVADTIITIVASGRLVGVRKKSDKVIDDGRLYVAKYVWSEDDAEIAADIRKTMALY